MADGGAPTLNQRAEGVADSDHRYAERDTCAFLGGGGGQGHKVRKCPAAPAEKTTEGSDSAEQQLKPEPKTVV